ncbi:hypothetical protein LEP1GSC043_3585 [Leptospira weilii str. Ecochallenge]|uniref:Uncharacterized protein n=1 Tax=Leptospira weilii str. Ecochallenge TaxID=1049986 RepID=N1U609_9LEPT|nr:hypothetical protein LEP1GSC043_3585 [Leptospira weilii str. Ecochallenge]
MSRRLGGNFRISFQFFFFHFLCERSSAKKIKTIKNDIDLLNSNLLFFIAIITRKTKTI